MGFMKGGVLVEDGNGRGYVEGLGGWEIMINVFHPAVSKSLLSPSRSLHSSNPALTIPPLPPTTSVKIVDKIVRIWRIWM